MGSRTSKPPRKKGSRVGFNQDGIQHLHDASQGEQGGIQHLPREQGGIQPLQREARWDPALPTLPRKGSGVGSDPSIRSTMGSSTSIKPPCEEQGGIQAAPEGAGWDPAPPNPSQEEQGGIQPFHNPGNRDPVQTSPSIKPPCEEQGGIQPLQGEAGGIQPLHHLFQKEQGGIQIPPSPFPILPHIQGGVELHPPFPIPFLQPPGSRWANPAPPSMHQNLGGGLGILQPNQHLDAARVGTPPFPPKKPRNRSGAPKTQPEEEGNPPPPQKGAESPQSGDGGRKDSPKGTSKREGRPNKRHVERRGMQ